MWITYEQSIISQSSNYLNLKNSLKLFIDDKGIIRSHTRISDVKDIDWGLGHDQIDIDWGLGHDQRDIDWGLGHDQIAAALNSKCRISSNTEMFQNSSDPAKI